MKAQREIHTITEPAKRKTAMSKAETALLEPFSGLPQERIHIPAKAEQFAAALDEIRTAGTVGFDTETKPVFTKGVFRDGPDIVQFATGNAAFIFQLHRVECQPFLVEILLAEDILKVGFDLRSDLSHLRRKFGIEGKAVLDLGTIFRKRGYRNT
ncbi:MAG TPA: 3'-5' exonuclease domain-containing protein 2, partial [Candidatus Ozemobacteraceae bacterium]|nr:3'-5' exonuclease domain-containing protein 2 [Candidatus Ozemobacteraceae bacterium]